MEKMEKNGENGDYKYIPEIMDIFLKLWMYSLFILKGYVYMTW